MWWWPERPQASQRHAELMPGGLSVVGPGWLLQTLVGSCVAVVLWDPASRYGGMCHFVLSHRGSRGEGQPPASSPDARYGVEALALLKDRMGPFTGLGSAQAPVAHVIGGAAMLDAHDGRAGLIGRTNAELALGWVAQEGLRLGEVQVGGQSGRRIRFDTSTGALDVTDVVAAPANWPAVTGTCWMWPA
jgi:chemotaxis protein CheD